MIVESRKLYRKTSLLQTKVSRDLDETKIYRAICKGLSKTQERTKQNQHKQNWNVCGLLYVIIQYPFYPIFQQIQQD